MGLSNQLLREQSNRTESGGSTKQTGVFSTAENLRNEPTLTEGHRNKQHAGNHIGECLFCLHKDIAQ